MESVEQFKSLGLLLQQDPRLPSVAGLIAGEPVKGSWWAHPQSHAIFRAATKLAAHRDTLVCKLVSRKTTYVHRDLWPAVLGVALARERWQIEPLSAAARALLARVKREGRIETSGAAARELENALLLYSEQVHTEAGSHAKVLETWGRWAKRVRAGNPLAPEEGKRRLEETLRALNHRFGARGTLPWIPVVRPGRVRQTAAAKMKPR